MNKLIPILLGGVALIVGVVGWFAMSSDDASAPVVSMGASAPPLPPGKVDNSELASLQSAASYAAQLKGTTGQIQSLEQRFKTYMDNTDKKITAEAEKIVQRQLPQIREQIRQEEQARLAQTRQPVTTSPAPALLGGTSRVIDTTVQAPALPAPVAPAAGSSRLLNPALANVPSGFGFDDLGGQVRLPFDSLSDPSAAGAATLGATTPRRSGLVPQQADPSALPGYVKVAAWQPQPALAVPGTPSASANPGHGGKMVDTTKPGQTGKAEKPAPIPVYTIENTSTLFSNTTMTALMGVVPNKNNAVKNLMRFKVITGPENIASNGLLLPDVKNIIWTGYAIGNREMECVQATVDTITFTFQDGTIRTVSKKAGGSGQKMDDGLGYLSDRWGKPCIKGTLISNAAQYLRDRMIAAGAAATAASAAAMQTTTSRDALGGTSTTVTGSQGEYIAGQTGTATLNELAAYLRDRMDQAVDIIYLDAGKDVVIHVEEQINIDYDPAGRKLSHLASAQQAVRARKARLD